MTVAWRSVRSCQWAAGCCKPEAAYFTAEDGKRAGMMVFEMADPSRIAQIAERLFLSLNAAVEPRPVMNRVDLRCALDRASTWSAETPIPRPTGSLAFLPIDRSPAAGVE